MENAPLPLRTTRPPGQLASPSPVPSETPLSRSAAAATPASTTVRVRRKPIPRKGHRKSRGGCLKCKQRKVKCQENTPICSNCSRLGLGCEYPSSNQNNAAVTTPTPTAPLQSTGACFTMQDFKFFHHFVFYAYPPLPLQENAVWKGIAAISHHFDFLSHAMLGLGASHLSLLDGENYRAQALTHRVTAIKSLNQAMSRPCTSEAEANALYATLMVLAFQSSYMLDGMHDIFPMIRGCFLVVAMSLPQFTANILQQFSWQKHAQNVQDISQDIVPESSQACFIDAASNSLTNLEPLCNTTLERTYLNLLQNIIAIAKVSLVNSILAIPQAYAVFAYPTQSEFNSFMNDDNFTAQILMAHFFILEYAIGNQVLVPIKKAYPFRTAIITAWVKGVEKLVPSTHKKYMNWPMGFIESIVAENSKPLHPPGQYDCSG